MINLHDAFEESEHPHPPEDPEGWLARCKKLLYAYPTGRHLVDILNLRLIPVHITQAEQSGYDVRHHRDIVLKTAPDTTVTEMAFHLACAIRAVELHLQTFLSPEMKDSKSWMHSHLSEPFEIMLTTCKLAYDMKFSGPNEDVDEFLEKNKAEKIYEAYEQQLPFSHMEHLMLESFNSRT